MHILFLTENFPPEVNASATRVSERLPYWVAAGHEVTVVTCFPNFPQGRLYPGWRQRPFQVEQTNCVRVVRLGTYIARNEGFLNGTDIPADTEGMDPDAPESVEARAMADGWVPPEQYQLKRPGQKALSAEESLSVSIRIEAFSMYQRTFSSSLGGPCLCRVAENV